MQAGRWQGEPKVAPVCLITVITPGFSSSHFLEAWVGVGMFKGIYEACSSERGPFTPPPAPRGLFLYFGSELGGGDGASDPATDSRASCLKRSAGEWCVGGSRLGCTPGGRLPALHARSRMSTRVSHHSCISSSLTRCHIPSPLCKPGDQSPQGMGQGEEGPRGGGWRGLHPIPHILGHMQAFWGLYSAALEVVTGSAILNGVLGFSQGKVPPPHVQRPITDQHWSE